MWTAGSAGIKAAHNGLVVAVEPYAEGGPPASPGAGSQYNGVQFFPLYAVLQLLCDHRPLNH